MSLVDPPEPASAEITTDEFMAGQDAGWDPPEPEPEADASTSDPPGLEDPPAPDDPPEPLCEPGAPLPLAEPPRIVPDLEPAADQPCARHAPVTRADLEAIGQQTFQLSYPLPEEPRR